MYETEPEWLRPGQWLQAILDLAEESEVKHINCPHSLYLLGCKSPSKRRCQENLELIERLMIRACTCMRVTWAPITGWMGSPTIINIIQGFCSEPFRNCTLIDSGFTFFRNINSSMATCYKAAWFTAWGPLYSTYHEICDRTHWEKDLLAKKTSKKQ